MVNLADNKTHVMSDLEKTASDKLGAIDCTPKIEGDTEKRMPSRSIELQNVPANPSQAYERPWLRKLATPSYTSNALQKSLPRTTLWSRSKRDLIRCQAALILTFAMY